MTGTREWALRHGLRQTDVALIGGVTPRAAGNWWRGRTLPPQSLRLLMRAVDERRLDVEWLAQAVARESPAPAREGQSPRATYPQGRRP